MFSSEAEKQALGFLIHELTSKVNKPKTMVKFFIKK